MSANPENSAAKSAPKTEPSKALVEKMRRFVREQLEPGERVLFAALLAPGVATALSTDGDVAGFQMVKWTPNLPEALADELREAGISVQGLD